MLGQPTVVLLLALSVQACAHQYQHAHQAQPLPSTVLHARAPDHSTLPETFSDPAQAQIEELTPEQQSYIDRHTTACERLDAPPVGIVQKLVKTPSDVPLEYGGPDSPDDAGKPELSPANVNAVVVANLPSVSACLQDALDHGWPDTAGHLRVRFAITGSGKVDGVAITESDISLRPLLCCVASVFERAEFPVTNRKGALLVTYPLTLRARTN